MEKMDGHFLRKLREERGWSLREFAEKIYTSKSTVQRWEQSSPPGDKETCARIAEAFGMSEEALRARGEAFRTEQARAEQKKREKELTPEQLAELKFGTKKLLVALGVLAAAALLAVLLPLLLTLLL